MTRTCGRCGPLGNIAKSDTPAAIRKLTAALALSPGNVEAQDLLEEASRRRRLVGQRACIATGQHRRETIRSVQAQDALAEQTASAVLAAAGAFHQRTLARSAAGPRAHVLLGASRSDRRAARCLPRTVCHSAGDKPFVFPAAADDGRGPFEADALAAAGDPPAAAPARRRRCRHRLLAAGLWPGPPTASPSCSLWHHHPAGTPPSAVAPPATPPSSTNPRSPTAGDAGGGMAAVHNATPIPAPAELAGARTTPRRMSRPAASQLPACPACPAAAAEPAAAGTPARTTSMSRWSLRGMTLQSVGSSLGAAGASVDHSSLFVVCASWCVWLLRALSMTGRQGRVYRADSQPRWRPAAGLAIDETVILLTLSLHHY